MRKFLALLTFALLLGACSSKPANPINADPDMPPPGEVVVPITPAEPAPLPADESAETENASGMVPAAPATAE